MAKVTYIGAGSSSFGKRLMMDISTGPALADGTFAASLPYLPQFA